MKAIKFLFLLSILVLTTNCTTDDTTQDGQLFATVDGEGFTASTENTTAVVFAGNLTITGMNNAQNSIIITVLNFEGEGTYDLSTSASIGTGVYLTSNTDEQYVSILDGGSGSVTITDYDEDQSRISGTFVFTGIQELDTVKVTNGSFTDLLVSTSLPESGNPNMLTALVDDTAFAPDSVEVVKNTLSGQTIVSIVAIESTTDQSISLSFGGELLEGTFDLEAFPTGTNYVASYNPDISNSESPFTSQTGSTVTISSYDSTTGAIEGTFQFVATDILEMDETVYTISEGTFSVILP